MSKPQPYETITMPSNHGFKDGDIVSIAEPRLKRLRSLMTKPRVRYVSNATATTFDLAERRMTWPEWLRSVLACVKG